MPTFLPCTRASPFRFGSWKLSAGPGSAFRQSWWLLSDLDRNSQVPPAASSGFCNDQIFPAPLEPFLSQAWTPAFLLRSSVLSVAVGVWGHSSVPGRGTAAEAVSVSRQQMVRGDTLFSSLLRFTHVVASSWSLLLPSHLYSVTILKCLSIPSLGDIQTVSFLAIICSAESILVLTC